VGVHLAANPFMHLTIKKIRAKGGYSYLLDQIASGRALMTIAREDFECSRHTLYKILHRNDRLWKLFLEARRESAMALAEEAGEIADALQPGSVFTREDVAAAKLRIEQRMRMAAAFDRETFGIQQQPVGGQSVSIGSLYLSVLQQAPVQKQITAPSVPALPPKDAEIVEVTP
jgi:hypothetical protein